MTCSFILSLLNSFDLPSCSSESSKRYTLSLLLMCLEVLGEWFSCFPWIDWEEFSRKLLSLVKLYQRIWTWNCDQNLIIALLILPVCTVLADVFLAFLASSWFLFKISVKQFIFPLVQSNRRKVVNKINGSNFNNHC